MKAQRAMQAGVHRNARILIVDDQEVNIHLLEGILGRAGYAEFRGVTDPRDVTLLYAEFQPDLVLLDLHMPHLDGYAVMEKLKLLIPADAYLPILVLTADVTADGVIQIAAVGTDSNGELLLVDSNGQLLRVVPVR